ncbi:MAG: SRPBCC domain-containing protein, partial [Candidatus Rokubacteria bacterium]|nr:SRPBCC domain-containing protein [Candidatus Rokubacteria bacterium]
RDTELSFTLSPADGRTTLAFAHRGWTTTDGIFAVCNFDWARYLMSLKAYLEMGRGVPHPG